MFSQVSVSILDKFFDLLVRVAELPLRFVVFVRRLSKWKKRSGHYLVEVGNRPSQSTVRQVIPTVLYQTTARKLVDHEHFSEINRFRDLNPELTFVVFDEDETDAYMMNNWGAHPIFQIYKDALFGQIKADIFRLCVLFDNGGYYFDINKAAFINLVGLHSREDSALITFDRDDCVIFPPVELASKLEFPHKLFAQWGFGFAKGHPVLKMAIERIVEMAPYFYGRDFMLVRDAIFAFSAPGMLTDVIRRYLLEFGFDGVAIAGRFFEGTGYARVRGSQRSPKSSLHYTAARNSRILRGDGGGPDA